MNKDFQERILFLVSGTEKPISYRPVIQPSKFKEIGANVRRILTKNWKKGKEKKGTNTAEKYPRKNRDTDRREHETARGRPVTKREKI